MFTDVELYLKSTATLVASWEEYARHAIAGSLVRSVGVAIAVFVHEPERTVYNNALLEGDLDPLQRADAIDAMEATYAQASITNFAAWVHESDAAMRADLEWRGYVVVESTRAMGMPLDDVRVPPVGLSVKQADWMEHLRVAELSSQFLSNGDHAAFHVLVGSLDGENVATAMAFDSGTDCGIFNVGTMEHARRHGLGTALTVAHLNLAVARGCQTASLQSTTMAESVYAAVGFRDLGRILEYGLPR